MALPRRMSFGVVSASYCTGGSVPKNQATPMTDKELVRRLLPKNVRKELKALLAQKDAEKRAKKTKKRERSSASKSV